MQIGTWENRAFSQEEKEAFAEKVRAAREQAGEAAKVAAEAMRRDSWLTLAALSHI